MPYTREEYIAKFGYDPELDKPIDPNTDAGKPGVARNVLSTVTSEIGALPTLAASVPQELLAGSKAAYTAYTEDKNFLEEYQRERMNDDAQKNIDQHLRDVAQAWVSEEPDLSEEDLQKSLGNYVKSKEFEDFTSSQLKGAIWLNNRWKDTLRGVQGDERTEAERPMWEDIVGIAATAGVGTSAKLPLAAANWAAKVGGVTNAAINNPITRGTLKTAELLTPVTIPYTPINAALNFGVGVGINQAERYATGQPTMFSNEDDSGVKAMAATGAGVTGVLAFVGAMRGRTVSLMNAAKSDTAKLLANRPSIDTMVADPMRPGQAGIVSGEEQQLHPPSYNETLPWYKRAYRTAVHQGIDENAMLVATIRDVQGKGGAEAASRIEGNMSMLTGSIGRDRRLNQTMTMTQPINDILNAMPAQEARAAEHALDMTSYAAELDIIRQHNVDEIDRLTKAAKNATSPQGKAAAQKSLKDLKERLARFDADEESARPRLPDTPMTYAREMAATFKNDQSPHMLRLKDTVKKLNRDILDGQIEVGKLEKSEADKMHARNPYFVQATNDPLKGDVGAARVWRSANQAADRKLSEAASGTTGAMLRESPIEALDRTIPKPRGPNDPETRITALLNTRSSIRQYTEHHLLDTNHTRARNDGIRHLAFKDGMSTVPNNETDFYKNGHIQIVKVDNKEWIPAIREKDGDIAAILKDPRTTREWQGGYFRIWKLGDVSIAAALRAEPVLFNGLVRAASKSSNLFKWSTTGYGNPFFALTNALYDASFGIVNHPKNRSYGLLRYATNRFLPEKAAKYINAVVPDPTPLLTWPIYSTKALIELMATRGARFAAKQLEMEAPGFSAMKAAMGPQAYQQMVARALKVAAMTQELSVNHAFRQGFSRSAATVDSIPKVRGHYEVATDRMPTVLRNIVQLYKDVVNAIYLGPKLQYYTENYSLLYHKHKGNIPQHELERLDYDVHGLGGHMDKVAANNFARQAESATPYMTQTKLGAYQLLRNLGSPETRMVVWPRLFQFMTMYGAGAYMMTSWNDEARHEYWNRQTEYDRYRHLYIPTIQLLSAWFRGENPAFSRDLIYRIPIAPDFVGITAGAAAIMEMTGMLPSGATPKPIAPNYPNIVLESMLPAMPPVMQLMLAASGMRLDPQTAERRGGNWIRSFNNAFKGGPDAESATSLGEVSTTTSLMLNAAFGVIGNHLAIASDVLLHASKHEPTVMGGKLTTQRQQADFATGLRKAAGEVFNRLEKKIPDTPALLWQNRDKYQAMTPAWQYVGEAEHHLKSIKGMHDNAVGKTNELRRQVAASVGGMPRQVLQDAGLIAMTDDITKFTNPTGELGMLKADYKKLSDMYNDVMVNYNEPQTERTRKGNLIMRQQQDNMRQQHLAILYKEQELEGKYGKYIAPMLKGRGVTMSSIDAMLRERVGIPARQQPAEAATAQEQ